MDVDIALLGGFSVAVDGCPVPRCTWSRRGAASLVKLLALADGRRLHREQVIDALWPGLPVDAAGPRLHKAAHYARRALGDVPDALLLRQDQVVLLPDRQVSVDSIEFERLGRAALAAGVGGRRRGGAGGVRRAAAARGPLRVVGRGAARDASAPARGPAAPWPGAGRSCSGRGPDRRGGPPRPDPRARRAWRRRAALRQLERMDQALRRELGTVPSDAMRTAARRAHAAADRARTGRAAGRAGSWDATTWATTSASGWTGPTPDAAPACWSPGSPGVGKTAMLDLRGVPRRRARLADRPWRRLGRRGLLALRAGAGGVRGPLPPAPGAARRAGRRVQRRDRARAGRPRDQLERRGRATSASSSPSAELLRLAASGHGLLLVVDDVHEADEASLRLLHYLARCAVGEPVVIALAHATRGRPGAARGRTEPGRARRRLRRRAGAARPRPATRRLVADRFPELDPAQVDEIWAGRGGLPFRVVELARSAAERRP